MIRIFEDDTVPKYQTGLWNWNNANDQLTFASWKSDVLERELYVETSGGIKFKASMNQIEEVTFRQEFARSDSGTDASEIIIADIKNLVLFLAPDSMMNNNFLHFIHTKTVDCFLNAIVIYFEHFLHLVEFILVRRDEVSGKAAQVESPESSKIKRIYSENLAQHRILLAREYSEILRGKHEMSSFYHMNVMSKMSSTGKDRKLFEEFFAFTTQFVWIAHHRRAYDVIESEINRLFRSHHFKLNRKDAIEFTKFEQDLLFGKNNKTVNCRRQVSPAIQEIARIDRKNLPILWIGKKKYRGDDLRVQELEMEYIVPPNSLSLINVKHGIFGNPRIVFNTMLYIDWESVRKFYTSEYDPHQLLTQPSLEIPKYDELRDTDKEYLEPYFEIKDMRFTYDQKSIKKWLERQKVMDYISGGGVVINVIEKCRRELQHWIQPKSFAAVAEVVMARRKLLRIRKR